MMCVYNCVIHLRCRTGLCAPGSTSEELPIRKRTTLMTNSQSVVDIFKKLQCKCRVPHFHVQGSHNGIPVSKHCQIYTPGLCDKLAEAVWDEFRKRFPDANR